MMTAKTVFTEAAASTAAPAGNNAAAPTAPGETKFQNLLAGAVPSIEPSLIDTLPTQLAQLLPVKATAAAKAPVGAAPLPADVSPSDMLKILDAAATLLPEAGESDRDATAEIPGNLVDTEELARKDDDILSEWLDMMIPVGVFVPQAGSGSAGDALQGGDAERKGGALPTSLTRQAPVPEQLTPIDVAPPGTAASATNGVSAAAREAFSAQNSVNAFAVALTVKTDSAEKDKPSADGWMSALGDMAAKRGQDVAAAAGPRLSTPVHDARWADAVANRLVMMARDGESSASLKLIPQDLGPLDIQINVRDGEASVHFGAAHQETRAVLEASLPRLRELLGAQGLQLSNATVSHQSGGQNRSEKSSGVTGVGAIGEDTDVASAKAVSTALLDIYA